MKSMRSFGFAFALLVFACILLSGGQRLIGFDGAVQPKPLSVQTVNLVQSEWTAAPAPQGQSGCLSEKKHLTEKQSMCMVIPKEHPSMYVLSDANGNVLGCRSYIHEVYQAFVLSDGFA